MNAFELITSKKYGFLRVSKNRIKTYYKYIVVWRLHSIFKMSVVEASLRYSTQYVPKVASRIFRLCCDFFGEFADDVFFKNNYDFLPKYYTKRKRAVLKCAHAEWRAEVNSRIKNTNRITYDTYKNDILDKIKNTKFKKYGDENYNNVEQNKQTCLKKYGVNNGSKTQLAKDKISQSRQNADKNEQAYKTFVKNSELKYGVKNPKHIHLKNYENFNREFIISNFMKNGKLMVRAMKDYFGYSANSPSSPRDCKFLNLKDIPPYRNGHGQSEEIFIKRIENQLDLKIERQFKIPGTNFRVDGYCRETNTIYEFLGDYWHGNPEKYKPEMVNKNCNEPFKNLYGETLKRFEIIATGGFKIKFVWENDFNNYGLEKLKEYRPNDGEL